MSKITITKCDICGDEERSDKAKYWAHAHSGHIAIDFRHAPSIQSNLSKESLCHNCAFDLYHIILDGIEYIKSDKVSQTDSI